MTTSVDSQVFESYVPVYDTVPEDWEEARQFLVEQLKKISNAVNHREIGYYINDEMLSGKQFIGLTATPRQYRDIFRIVVPTGPLVAGLNPPKAHGVNFDANFTLIDLWVSGTDTVGFLASVITDDNVIMNAIDVIITSPRAYTEGFIFIEYTLEN